MLQNRHHSTHPQPVVPAVTLLHHTDPPAVAYRTHRRPGWPVVRPVGRWVGGTLSDTALTVGGLQQVFFLKHMVGASTKAARQIF